MRLAPRSSPMARTWMPVVSLLAVLSSASPATAESIEVRGKAIDAGTGKPVGKFVEQGGRVDPKDPSKVVWGFSEGRTEGENPEGTFRLTIDWDGGQRVRLLADGYLPQPVLVEPPPEGAASIAVTVVMKRGREVAGAVLDARGKPVAGASVFLVGKRQVNLTGGRAVRGFGGGEGEDETVTRSTTDGDGRFTVSGAGDDVGRLAVSGAAIDLWVVPVPKDDGKPATIRLPDPGKLVVKYDVPGGPDEGVFLLQFKTYERPGWEGIDNLNEPRAPNRGETTLANLPPGDYTMTRVKTARLGDLGKSILCDRRTITIKSGETTDASFVRDRGAPIAGRIEGLDRDKYSGAFVSVRPGKASGDPFARGEMMLPTFDFTTAAADDSFSTERLLPGDYTVVVEAYAPRPRDGRFTGGIDPPALVGTAKVTVPAVGKPEPVVIALKPPVFPRVK